MMRTVASLREDYLNQVQRDFLSRHPGNPVVATPLADVLLRTRLDCTQP
jgi:hypothetical protein